MAVLSYDALALWLLGYPSQALKKCRRALTIARGGSHPYTLAFALGFASQLHQFRREEQLTREQAELAITLSTERGFPQFLGVGMILRGWALAKQRRVEEGIAHMCQGLNTYRATGAELFLTYFLALLAGDYGKVGQTEKGLVVLAEALALMQKNGDCFWEAELYRLKGELLLMQGGAEAEVEECFRRPSTWPAIRVRNR